MVASAGAGPPPLPRPTLNAEVLADAFETLLAPETLEAAQILSYKMQQENGVKSAVNSFHRNLPVKDLSCDFIPTQPAIWQIKHKKRTYKLSHDASRILTRTGRIDEKNLKP